METGDFEKKRKRLEDPSPGKRGGEKGIIFSNDVSS